MRSLYTRCSVYVKKTFTYDKYTSVYLTLMQTSAFGFEISIKSSQLMATDDPGANRGFQETRTPAVG